LCIYNTNKCFGGLRKYGLSTGNYIYSFIDAKDTDYLPILWSVRARIEAINSIGIKAREMLCLRNDILTMFKKYRRLKSTDI